MGKANFMRLQPVYTMTGLAELLCMSRGRTRRLLKRAGIVGTRDGNHRLVYVSEIEQQMPELWASVLACERARAITRALEGLGGLKK